MPNEAKISIFTDNDLTHITDDHFEINLIAHLLDQIYVVPSALSPPRYDSIHTYDAKTFAYKSHLIWMYSYKISYFYMTHIFYVYFSQNNTLK